MSISRLTKESEERISSALSKVAERTNRGESPNDAIVKVASDMSIPAGHVRLMVRAFNNGRSLGHIRNHSELTEKAAAFPLADASEVLERMFPSKVETPAEKAAAVAVSDDYRMSPKGWLQRREKAASRQNLLVKAASADKSPEASPYPTDPRRAGKEAMAKIGELSLEHERLKEAAVGASYKVAADVNAVGDYFGRPDSFDINEVRVNAQTALGAPGGKLVEHACRMYKYAMVNPVRFTHAVDWEQEPYSLIKQALDSMVDFTEKRAALDKFEEELPEKKAEALRPFCQRPGNDVIVGSVWDNQSQTKQAAGLLGLTVAGLVGGSARGMSEKMLPKSKEDLIQERMQELADPAHEDKLRAIRMQTMMHEMMATDPVISGYEPEMVLEAFNHLSEVAPRAMQQRVMAQALLRKYLEQASALDTFDVDQMLDVEGKIQERDMPQQLAQSQSTGTMRELGPPQSKPRGITETKEPKTNPIDETLQGIQKQQKPVLSELFKPRQKPVLSERFKPRQSGPSEKTKQ